MLCESQIKYIPDLGIINISINPKINLDDYDMKGIKSFT